MTRPVKLTIGMDVGDTYSHLAVLDDSGVVVRRDRVATKERSIRTWFGRYLGSTVALEVGRHSPWISRLLTEMGFEPIVGNPRKIALIHGATTSATLWTRRSSPVWLASILRCSRPWSTAGRTRRGRWRSSGPVMCWCVPGAA